MANQDDPKRDPSEDKADEEEAPDSEPSPDSEDSPDSDDDADERPRRASAEKPRAGEGRGKRPAPGGISPVVVVAAVVALAAGAAGGWFGHDAQAKAKLRAESVAAPAGSGAPSGPCGAWQQKICSSAGDPSAACAQAKGALDLLTPSACEVALAGVPATLAKVKAARAGCDTLVSKLCADLQPGSAACVLVKERTPSFPRERCDEMLQHYDEVIKELRQMEQQQAMSPHGGMPPGAMPPGAMPPGGKPPAPPAHP